MSVQMEPVSRATEEYSPFIKAHQQQYGRPQQHSRFNRSDFLYLGSSLVCLCLGLVSVFVSRTATWLGQTNQLVIVGFLLSVMAWCFQGPAQKVLVAAEISRGSSTIQNLENIVQMKVLGRHRSLATRLNIVFLLGIPIGLSAAYKQFIGGMTVTTGSTTQKIAFGPTPPPDTDNIGWGLSLFSSTMRPWWSNPEYPASYGYSLATVTKSKTALLDSPLSHEISRLRGSVRGDQIQLVTANVSAVEARLVAAWDEGKMTLGTLSTLQNSMNVTQCNDLPTASCTLASLFSSYFQCIWTHQATFLFSSPWTVGMAVGPCVCPQGGVNGCYSNKLIIVSRAEVEFDNATSAQVYPIAGQALEITLQRYQGVWNVTQDTTSLVRAIPLETGGLANASYNFENAQHLAIDDIYYGLQDSYLPMASEFNWNNFHAPDSVKATTADVSTDTTFAATMVWSRMATHVGPTSKESLFADVEHTLRYTIPVGIQIYTQTLKRHWALAMVLAIYPVLTLSTILFRTIWLGFVPVSDGFGVVSLLAAVKPEGLTLLKGAGYSGKLKTPIHSIFSVTGNDGQRRLQFELIKNKGIIDRKGISKNSLEGKDRIY
ncbi:hypothetical protein H2200_013435 [Cladophialophora chaetospira]|uniref:Uncharacterized protein n=1 Tax=Cladophialophora chaetospira TaxID=386627 RepID=A0AA38TXH3_9EURO|nr:hypothetical protein H2200_013435 [Cladophialophora chaetospira]